MSRTFGVAAVALVLSLSTAHADRPAGVVNAMVPLQRAPNTQPFLISHILYLNKCANNACKVTVGATDSRAQTSDIARMGGTLSPYTGDWNGLMNCMNSMMSPFNLTVTDVDPGASIDHFEVMIGGFPGQIGLGNGIGGIADYPCGGGLGSCPPGTYIQDALVFDFAGVWGNDVTTTCGTAAQEIAHAWTLDHATPNTDPMTYNGYATPLHYQNAAPCGSDCGFQCPGGGNNCNAFGVTCTGQLHPCMETGTATQNEVDIIKALFGPAGAAAPTVKFTSPTDGGAEMTGSAFNVVVECTTNDGVAEIDLEIDGAAVATLATSPAMFMAPANLTEGTHTFTAACGTNLKASAQTSIKVIVGHLCSHDSDCPTNDICYEMACIAGPNATNGLGATCTNNGGCASGQCASDGTNMLCVVPCDPNHDQCPNGFGCIMAGTGGVCWKGAPHGGGGCNAGGGGGLVMFGAFATWITRRRRRAPKIL
jgi:uncharacterized protein (TIGR03382 family)